MATEHTTLLVSEPPDRPQFLPLTLLESVFQNLDKSSLAAFCLVSRAIGNEAERILYRHIKFTEHFPWYPEPPSFELFHRTITSSQRLARYVRLISLSHCQVKEIIIETLFALTELRYLNLDLRCRDYRWHQDNGFISVLVSGCTFKLHTLISRDCGSVHFYEFLESQTSLEVWLDKTSRYEELYTPAPSALSQISILEITASRFCSAFSSIHLSYLRLNDFIFNKEHQVTQAVHALRACGHSLVGLCFDQEYPIMYEVCPGFMEMVSDVLDAVPNVKYLCLLGPFQEDFRASNPKMNSSYIACVTSKELEGHQSVLELVNSKLPRLDTFVFDTISPQSSELALRQDFALLSAGNVTLKRYICYQEVHLDHGIRFDRVECCRLPNGEVRILPDTNVYNDMSWPELIAVLEEGYPACGQDRRPV